MGCGQLRGSTRLAHSTSGVARTPDAEILSSSSREYLEDGVPTVQRRCTLEYLTVPYQFAAYMYR